MKLLFTLIFSFNLLFAQMEGLKIQKNLPNAIKIAKEKQKDILLFIYNDHCWYCKSMKKNTFSDKKVIKLLNNNFIFVMEEQNSKNLSKRFDTNFVPMIYMISYEDDEILLELPGHKNVKTFMEIISDYVF